MDLLLFMARAADLLVATVWGSMVFFAAVVAPLVFTKLDEETAGRFIRQVFPRYYTVLTALSAVAAALLFAVAAGSPTNVGLPEAVVMAIVALGFLVSQWGLMPRINDLRDAAKGGDPAAARKFSLLHRFSVWINTAQLVAVAWVLWQG